MTNKFSWQQKIKRFFNWLIYRGDGKEPDYTLFVLLLVILILGLIFLASASSVISFDEHHDPYYFFKKQFFQGIFFGLILFIFTSHVHYNFFKKNALFLLFVGIILLVLVFSGIGLDLLGGRRWLKLFRFSFQPAEYVKIALIIYLAAWFDSRSNNIKSFKMTFLPFLILLCLVVILILLQPDMGTALLLVALSITMYYLAGGQLGFLLSLTAIGSVIFYFLIKNSSYRAARLMVFLNPELDPQGIGYHINQAILAIGSGGIFGRGLGHSRQKFNYLPEVAGDSIFAIIAEELGFIFTFIFLLLYFYFFYRILQLAFKAPDNFSKFFILGFFSLLIWQSFLNIMAMLGLVPLTGMPLPFISHGSSSLAMLLAGMGIIFNISKYRTHN